MHFVVTVAPVCNKLNFRRRLDRMLVIPIPAMQVNISFPSDLFHQFIVALPPFIELSNQLMLNFETAHIMRL